ncbi:growth-regulating factor 6-like [Dorcoceras hygrometricum]|uniref:Growth-regulating factor n=1 Tax=Dorcoceras hygrometricum TaxID=472368 RepID=A0A2Z7C4X1_9LAMI|nr:growth-regulating factor 6-like [Dorcoceras hygrometricum]
MEAHQRARMAVKRLLNSKVNPTDYTLSFETRTIDEQLFNAYSYTLKSQVFDEVLSNIYWDGGSTTCVGSTAPGFKLNTLQTFDISPPLNSTTASKASGAMASSVGLAFTSAQRKELERQAMIFRYLTTNLPLPHDLLYPLSLNFASPALDPSINLSGGELRNDGCLKIRDPEPGRCKRTDGKKWRCSKDVAPMQKYCERHLHKGRLRSRKPVEVRKKMRLEQGPLPAPRASSSASHQISTQNESRLLFNPIESDRNAGVMMEFESTENNWQHLMKKGNLDFLANGFFSTRGFNPTLHQDCVETSNPFPYSSFQAQSGVINTWSMDNDNATSCPVSLHQGNAFPSLYLSMDVASANVLDGESNKIEIEVGLEDSDDCYVADTRSLPCYRGGPLGEALQPLSVGVESSNPASPYDSVHTTATTVSSPSGVLHRTSFSHSENSVCNSPADVSFLALSSCKSISAQNRNSSRKTMVAKQPHDIEVLSSFIFLMFSRLDLFYELYQLNLMFKLVR